ncbi:MAG: hypothetical protein V1848_03970 [Candidatus Magasanikbacteria bacterium]
MFGEDEKDFENFWRSYFFAMIVCLIVTLVYIIGADKKEVDRPPDTGVVEKPVRLM